MKYSCFFVLLGKFHFLAPQFSASNSEMIEDVCPYEEISTTNPLYSPSKVLNLPHTGRATSNKSNLCVSLYLILANYFGRIVCTELAARAILLTGIAILAKCICTNITNSSLFLLLFLPHTWRLSNVLPPFLQSFVEFLKVVCSHTQKSYFR